MTQCKICIFSWIRDERWSSVSSPATGFAFKLVRLVDSATLATHLSTRAIARKIDAPYGSVRRWRRELIEAGLVSARGGKGLMLCAVSTSEHGVSISEHRNDGSVSRSGQGGCSDLDTPLQSPNKDTASLSTSTTPYPLTEDFPPSALDPSSSVVGTPLSQEQKPPPSEIEDASAPSDPTPEREDVLEGKRMKEIETRWDAAVAASPALDHHWGLVGLVRDEIGKATPARIDELLEAIQCATDIGSLYKYALTILRKPYPKAKPAAAAVSVRPHTPNTPRDVAARVAALAEIDAMFSDEEVAA